MFPVAVGKGTKFCGDIWGKKFSGNVALGTLFGRIKNPYGYEIIVLNFYKPGVSPPSKVLAELGGTTTAFVTGHRFGICTQVRE